MLLSARGLFEEALEKRRLAKCAFTILRAPARVQYATLSTPLASLQNCFERSLAFRRPRQLLGGSACVQYATLSTQSRTASNAPKKSASAAGDRRPVPRWTAGVCALLRAFLQHLLGCELCGPEAEKEVAEEHYGGLVLSL